jgi:hypothetical protein
MSVVMNYKHWSKDEAFWNKEPIKVFDHVPDLKDLKPSVVNPKVVHPLSQCAAFPDFTDPTLLCCAKKGPKDAEGKPKPSNLSKCPRCRVEVAFLPEFRSSLMFSEEHKASWAKRWSEMTQESATSSLTEIKGLRSYDVQEPRLPYQLPKLLQGPSDAYLSVEPLTFAGYTETTYQRLLREAGVGVVNESNTSFAVEDVVGAMVDGKGNVQVAVVWANQNNANGGTWIPVDDVNVLFDAEVPGESESEDDSADNEQSADAKEAEVEKSVKRHNWAMYFGSKLDEDLDLLVAFKSGRDTTVYKGVVLTPDFDADMGTHRVHFPVSEADRLFGTVAQTRVNDTIDIRLDTLATSHSDSDSGDCGIAFWIKSNFSALPFISKKLPALKVAYIEKPKRGRNRNCRIDSDSDADQRRVHKKTKKSVLQAAASKTKKKKPKKPKKKTNKEEVAELMKTMHATPM